MPVSAAIAGGVSAAGSLASAGLGVYGSLTAANKQAATMQQALALQEQMFNTSQAALQPYIQSGQSVLPTLKSLLTPGPSQTSTLENLPGFQFQSQWGNLSATNALAARGLGGSTGPLATAISNYNQGLAGTSFANLAGLLQGYANMGSGAAGALAGNATQSGANMASTLAGLGSAQASGILGATNALSGGISGAASAGSNAYLLSQLLNGNQATNFYSNNPLIASGGGVGG